MPAGSLILFGSGETAPNLVRVHRDALRRFDAPTGVLLDTPFAFQENLPQLAEKVVDFFATSLQLTLRLAHLARGNVSDPVARGDFRAAIDSADYVFAGPGSPSYALEVWRAADLTTSLRDALRRGATVSFASAAALTLGTRTAPIYEIYKVGAEPVWLEGLNLLADFGLKAVIIPHFDNAEGQNHDTRCCYLGETRLALLAERLDDDEAILGIDEHTALVLDGDTNRYHVAGKGGVTWRTATSERRFDAGSEGELSDFAPGAGARLNVAPTTTPTSDVDELVRRVTLGGAEGESALATLAMKAREGNPDALDPQVLVPALLSARAAARAAGAYAVADAVRDALNAAGVEVMDGADGATWRQHPSN